MNAENDTTDLPEVEVHLLTELVGFKLGKIALPDGSIQVKHRHLFLTAQRDRTVKPYQLQSTYAATPKIMRNGDGAGF